MSGAVPIRVGGQVVEVLSHRLVQVELENGHRLMGHTTRSTSGLLEGTELGETVVLEVSMYDLSKGRVVKRNRKNENENE